MFYGIPLKYSNVVVLIILSCVLLTQAVVDNYPRNAGGTMGRNTSGPPIEAVLGNPALLGTQRIPRRTFRAIPFSSYGVGYWSDYLEIPLFADYINLTLTEKNNTFNRIIREGMGVHESGDSVTVEHITTHFPNGASLYGGLKISLGGAVLGRFAMDLNTEIHSEHYLPEAALVALAVDSSRNDWGDYSFSGFGQHTVWVTNIGIAYGMPVPATPVNDFLHLPKTAVGIRTRYILGHSYVKTQNDTGGTAGLWNARYTASGVGLSPTGFNSPINGYGLNGDFGLILYSRAAAFSILTEKLGFIYWDNDLSEGSYTLTTGDLIRNQYFPQRNRDSVNVLGSLITKCPASFSVGYSYKWTAPEQAGKAVHNFAHALYGSATYKYTLYEYPGIQKGSRTSLGLSYELFNGCLPLRVGWTIGGRERQVSTGGLSFDFQNHSLDISYKAVGSYNWIPRRGFEVAGGLTWAWGFDRDWDNDKVIDKNDSCENIPEDRDGFEDSDGCPDPDNDNDGFPDEQDSCPDDAEDKDSFKDDDGCPDYDNDADSVPDTLDECSDIPEDKDGFEDSDGCPDYDNDADSVPDTLDECPAIPEDKDGFEDSDGCPDYDNDNDGIADTIDQCPDSAEVVNEFEDADGCPDEKPVVSPKPQEQLPDRTIPLELPTIHFASNSAELTPAVRNVLDSIATLLAINPKKPFEIQGHGDSLGSADFNLMLSVARAAVVREYLVSHGISRKRVIAVGYGESMPVDDNSTSTGRAANRRIVFERIRSREQYQKLLEQQQKQVPLFGLWRSIRH